MDVGVIGAGYVGLVTAACLAKLGHNVVCVDVDSRRVARLRAGDLPISEPGLDEAVRDGLESGRLRFADDHAELRGSKLAIVAVGTLDASGEWTIGLVREAVLQVARDALGPRSIVIRSTLLPGTTERLSAEASTIDANVRIAVNPEFTREGSAISDFLAPDRVVIGTSEPDGAIADELRRMYASLRTTVIVTDSTSAETIKVASNVFLAAKITFANELARICAETGANVAEVVDGIGLDQRIGRAFLTPGPGYGGSCLPAQARMFPVVASAVGATVPLMDSIAASDAAQADWIIAVGEAALGSGYEGRRVAVLGLTFKAGTDDIRESPAVRLVERLASRGATITVHDPMATVAAAAVLAGRGIEVGPARSVEDACRGVDAVFVATEWDSYRHVEWGRVARVMRGATIVDTRAVVDVAVAAAAGLHVVGLRQRPSQPSGGKTVDDLAHGTSTNGVDRSGRNGRHEVESASLDAMGSR